VTLPAAPSVVLVWPDVGQTEQDVREQLTALTGDLVVAQWDPGADDGGRSALLTSLRDAREILASHEDEPDALIVIGLGRGAVAAAGLARYAKRLGIEFGRVLCVAPRWNEPDPFSGAPVRDVPERVELVPDAAAVDAALRR
jgi:hypothetical protein